MMKTLVKSSVIKYILIVAVSWLSVNTVINKISTYSSKLKSTYIESDKYVNQKKWYKTEISRLSRENDEQIKVYRQQIESLQKDSESRLAEVEWARDRAHKREKIIDKLRSKDDEINDILDYRVPANIAP